MYLRSWTCTVQMCKKHMNHKNTWSRNHNRQIQIRKAGSFNLILGYSVKQTKCFAPQCPLFTIWNPLPPFKKMIQWLTLKLHTPKSYKIAWLWIFFSFADQLFPWKNCSFKSRDTIHHIIYVNILTLIQMYFKFVKRLSWMTVRP